MIVDLRIVQYTYGVRLFLVGLDELMQQSTCVTIILLNMEQCSIFKAV